MTPLRIARAWHSVQDEWIVRRNKSYAVRQWEVVHNWGRDVISDKTMKAVSRHETMEGAQSKAYMLEDKARGAAVLAALTSG